MRELFSSKRVRYVSTETMMNEFVDAMRSKHMPGFKRRYREVDVLLVDDIQFLERTEQLQEEFFYTFNDLHGRGSQIVISSDRPPKSIATIEDRLRSRFEWGLITDIQPPEFETRLAILRKKAESEHLDGIPDAVLGFIAENVVDNVRELEGSLIRVAAYSSLHRVPLTEDVAKEVLSDLLPASRPRVITPQLILDETAKMFGWTDRRALRQEPAPAARHRPPDRHVRVPGAHRLQLPEDRRGVRRPRPHHRDARLREDPRPDGRAARRVRAGQRADQPHQARRPVDNAVDDWGNRRAATRDNRLVAARSVTAACGICGQRGADAIAALTGPNRVVIHNPQALLLQQPRIQVCRNTHCPRRPGEVPVRA